jgi:hypothetical protein
MAYKRDTKLDRLRMMALRKGYTINKSVIGGYFRVVDDKERMVVKPDGSKAFSEVELKKFLGQLRDR